MNILYTVNNDYVPQLATGICSVCENNRDFEILRFYIFSDGISAENKNILSGFVKKYGRDIQFIDIDGFMDAVGLSLDTGGWNEVIMARLLMAGLLPDEVDKVLYLDADTVVRRSLRALWDEHPVRGILSMVMEPTASRARRASLGIERFPYFNSGVLLVDLKKWRKNGVESSILDYCSKNGDSLVASDQDAINVVLAGKIDAIPPKYNASNIFSYYPYRFLHRLMPEFSDEEECVEARDNPVIVHYLGEERPWRKGNTHAYRSEYEKYLSKTPFSGTLPEKGWEMYFVLWKAFNAVTKFFPSLRYKVIDGLIPFFLEFRSHKK